MKKVLENIHEWLKINDNSFGSKKHLDRSINLVQEEFDELKQGVLNDDREEVLDGIIDIFWCLQNVSYYYGISPLEIVSHFKLVEQSNFSKYCKTLEEANETVNLYKQGLHPNKMGVSILTYVNSTGNEKYPFVVLRESDGKILKSKDYIDVSDLK